MSKQLCVYQGLSWSRLGSAATVVGLVNSGLDNVDAAAAHLTTSGLHWPFTTEDCRSHLRLRAATRLPANDSDAAAAAADDGDQHNLARNNIQPELAVRGPSAALSDSAANGSLMEKKHWTPAASLIAGSPTKKPPGMVAVQPADLVVPGSHSI